MTELSQSVLDDLTGMLGETGLRHESVHDTLDPGMHPDNLNAGVVALPVSTEQVAAVVTYCAEQGIGMVPQGGRTGISSGAISKPGQLVIQLSRMNHILSLDGVAGTAVVEAGVTLQQLQQAAAAHDLALGVDLSARGSATLGGMVSTNAGGLEAFRHGMMRHRVLGLEAVLPNGAILDDLKQVTKANEGYDVKQLLIGADGTLGIVTRIVFDLVALDHQRATALVSCASAAAATSLFALLRKHRETNLLGAEIMWPDYARVTAGELGRDDLLDFEPDPHALFVLFDVADDDSGLGTQCLETVLGDCLENGHIIGAVIAKNEKERANLWLIREESFLADHRFPGGLWYDVSVPHSRLDEYVKVMLERVRNIHPDLKVFLFGHLGDGNLHLSVTMGRPIPEYSEPVNHAVYTGLNEMGGSFSAEHGIGAEKVESLIKYGSPEKLRLMRDIKQTLDPEGIMNPGKVV